MAPQAPTHGILKKFFHLAGAQQLRDILHTVFFIVLARLSSSHYGEFQVAFSTASIILFLGEFGLNQPLVAALNKKYSHKGDILAQYSLIKIFLLTAGWLGVLGFVYQQGYTPGLKNLVLVISAGMGMEALATSFFTACRVQGRQDLEAGVRAVSALVGYGWALGTLYMGAPPHVIALFKLIENAINLSGGAYVALRQADLTQLTLKRKALARTWDTARGGLVYVLMALCAILYNKANVFFLQQSGGPLRVAQYQVTWEMVDGVSILASNLMLRGILYPLFVKLWRTDKTQFDKLSQDCVRWLLGVAVPVMFVLAVESDRLISLIYGPNYGDAVWLQKILVWCILCGFLHNLQAYLMMSQSQQNMLFGMYVAGFVANLGLCAYLVPRYQLWGAGVAVVATKALVMLMSTVHCQRTMGLFRRQSLLPVALATALGAGLYYGLRPLVFRELAELAALVPFVVMGASWWKEMKARQAAIV